MEGIFKEGVEAFNQGMSYCVSPYLSCTIEYFFWKSGWEEALKHALITDQHPIQLSCKAGDE